IDLALVYKIRKYIKNNHIDVVHCHFADEGIHGFLSLAGLGNKILIQNFHVDFQRVRKIDLWKFKLINKFSSLNISCSGHLTEQLFKKDIGHSNKNISIHNGINPERVLSEKPGSLKSELNLGNEVVLAGMVGNFYNDIRDQITVCKALALAIKKHPDFHFVFAGGFENQWIKKDNAHFQNCLSICKKAGILQNVHFTGLRKDTGNIYASLDFYVHATNFDTFGMAPVEAMMNKLPVIANDVEVFKEVSGDGEGMLLFKDKNHVELANMMDLMISDAALRSETGQKHFDFAMKNYHIKVHLEKLKNIYLSLL
ncbi:MAG: glycosyltransferase family 4 protein, partial [Bacteroidetes bacterium]|nr:glycosyltransferase family 4 protein [Bacteroidota bacterium]